MEAILDAIGGLSAGRAGGATAGVFGAMKRGPIPGVNIAPNTAFRGYRGGETGLSAQSGQTLAIAPNTLPFADLGLLPRRGGTTNLPNLQVRTPQ